MSGYRPMLSCHECGRIVMELSDEQEARRAADPSRFEFICTVCVGPPDLGFDAYRDAGD